VLRVNPMNAVSIGWTTGTWSTRAAFSLRIARRCAARSFSLVCNDHISPVR
jgi:hypothetical protein